MTLTARSLAVTHQTEGECSWCDQRYLEILEAFRREYLAEIAERYSHLFGEGGCTEQC